jgi:hypothetical protein
LLRLNHATRNNNNANIACFPNDNAFPGTATAGIFPPRGSESMMTQQRGISAATPEDRLPYTTSTMDPLMVAQLLVGGAGAAGAASPRNNEDLRSDLNSGTPAAQLLRLQTAAAARAAFLTGSSQQPAPTGFLDQQQGGSNTSHPSRNAWVKWLFLIAEKTKREQNDTFHERVNRKGDTMRHIFMSPK